jgi:hypothetical protein
MYGSGKDTCWLCGKQSAGVLGEHFDDVWTDTPEGKVHTHCSSTYTDDVAGAGASQLSAAKTKLAKKGTPSPTRTTTARVTTKSGRVSKSPKVQYSPTQGSIRDKLQEIVDRSQLLRLHHEVDALAQRAASDTQMQLDLARASRASLDPEARHQPTTTVSDTTAAAVLSSPGTAIAEVVRLQVMLTKEKVLVKSLRAKLGVAQSSNKSANKKSGKTNQSKEFERFFGYRPPKPKPNADQQAGGAKGVVEDAAQDKTDTTYTRDSERTKRRHTKAVHDLLIQLSARHPLSKTAEGAQQVMNELMACVLGRLGITTAAHSACVLLDRVRELMRSLKIAHKGRFPKASRDVLHTIAAAVSVGASEADDEPSCDLSLRQIEYLTGLNRSVLATGQAARARILDGKCAAPPVQARSDKIPQHVIDFTTRWWDDNTRESENTRDQICNVQLKRPRGSGLKQPKSNTHRVHYREATYLKMYEAFRQDWSDHNANLYKLHLEAKQRYDLEMADPAHPPAPCPTEPTYHEWSVKFTKFREWKPYYVKKARRDLCQCPFCLETDILVKGIAQGRVQIAVNRKCSCVNCEAGLDTFSTMLQLRGLLLCDKEDGQQFRRHACAVGTCEDCGVLENVRAAVPLCKEFEAKPGGDPVFVTIDVLQTVEVEVGGEVKKYKKFLPQTMVLSDIWALLESKRKVWLQHWDYQQVQAQIDRDLHKELRPHFLHVTMDFAENGSIQMAREMQSEYFRASSRAYTLHPMVVRGHVITMKPYLDKQSPTAYRDTLLDFWKQGCANGGGDINPVITVTLMFVSNSKEHSKFDVWHFNDMADDWFRENCDLTQPCSTNSSCRDRYWVPTMEERGATVDPTRTRLKMCGCKCGSEKMCYRANITFSDNCSPQYKNRASAYWISSQLANGNLPRWWFTHGASHGKCLCDGEGGRAKFAVNQACLEALKTSTVAQRFQTARDVADFLTANFQKLNSTLSSRCMQGVHSRVVLYADASDIRISTETYTEVSGILKAHRLLNCSQGKGKFLMGEYGCICDECLAGRFNSCLNPHGRSAVTHVQVKLNTPTARLTRQQVEKHGTARANACKVGENVVFTMSSPTEEFDGEPYFIGVVKETLQACPSDRVCGTFGTKLSKGDHFLVLALYTRKQHSLRMFFLEHDDEKQRRVLVPGKNVLAGQVELTMSDGEYAIASKSHTLLMRLARPDGGASGDESDVPEGARSIDIALAAPAGGELPSEVDKGEIRLPVTAQNHCEETSFTPDDEDLLLDDDEDDGVGSFAAKPKLPKGVFKIGKLMTRFTQTIRKKGKKELAAKWLVHWAGYDYNEDSPEFEEGQGHGCPGLKDGVTSDVWLGLVTRFRSQFEGFPQAHLVPSHVPADDHTQCDRKERCEGQRYYISSECIEGLCDTCAQNTDVHDREGAAAAACLESPHVKRRRTDGGNELPITSTADGGKGAASE